MLRCTLAGLLPIIRAEQTVENRQALFEVYKEEFQGILKHRSFYLIRLLPRGIALEMMMPELENLLMAQNKDGSWKKKDSERISYDILSALLQSGVLEELIQQNRFRYDLAGWTTDKDSEYALLTKYRIFHDTNESDKRKRNLIISEIKKDQQTNGSFHNSIIATCVLANKMLDFGLEETAETIQNAVRYLFSNFREKIDGLHVGSPYGFQAANVFCTENRQHEWEWASRLQPERLPRSVCYRHLCIQQNAEALLLLQRLGYDSDDRVLSSIAEQKRLLDTFHGLCDTDIKKATLHPKRK